MISGDKAHAAAVDAPPVDRADRLITCIAPRPNTAAQRQNQQSRQCGGFETRIAAYSDGAYFRGAPTSWPISGAGSSAGAWLSAVLIVAAVNIKPYRGKVTMISSSPSEENALRKIEMVLLRLLPEATWP